MALAMSLMLMTVTIASVIMVMVISIPSMTIMVVRNINVVVPAILYKVDWTTTGMVAAAIMAPSLGMARRHV